MAFSIQHVVRQISTELLKTYLDAKAPGEFNSVWQKPKSKHASAIVSRLVGIDDEVSQAISADVVRIHPLSSERGRNALLNAALGVNDDFTEKFSQLENDFERALWVLMAYPEIFNTAEELHFVDYYSDGNRGQHYRTTANLSVSRDVEDQDQFRSQICTFYRHRDGSGISCHVDFTDRTGAESLQVTVFVQGLPNNATEFVEGRFRRTISHPALEAAIVYEFDTGNVTTVAKGGKQVHVVLRDAFARYLLKVDPKYEKIVPRRFRLDALKTARSLPVDSDAGISEVRVRRLKLSPPGYVGHLIVEAPGIGTPVGVYDLGNQWFAEKARLFESFQVVQATIAMRFHKRPSDRKSKTINLELTVPNGSNLKSLKEADRKIAEAYIEKWNLIEPA